MTLIGAASIPHAGYPLEMDVGITAAHNHGSTLLLCICSSVGLVDSIIDSLVELSLSLRKGYSSCLVRTFLLACPPAGDYAK